MLGFVRKILGTTVTKRLQFFHRFNLSSRGPKAINSAALEIPLPHLMIPNILPDIRQNRMVLSPLEG